MRPLRNIISFASRNYLHQAVTLLKGNNSVLSDFELQHKTPRCIKTTPIPIALYGGRHTATMIPGGGMGGQLMEYVQELFRIMGVPVDFEVVDVNSDRDDNQELSDALTSIRRNGVAIKGHIETDSESTSITIPNVAMRNELDLFVYVLWCKTYPEIPSRHKNIDVIVVRQNTEGEYSMLEHRLNFLKGGSMVENLKIITAENSIRVAKFAFEYARRNKRKKITTVHKANIMKLSDGLFLKISQEVAAGYPDIQHDNIIIDNCCMQLVSRPERFDVLLTPNLYGSVVANVLCGMSGGAGLSSGKNYGDQYAVFEPGTRNLGRMFEEKDRANPVVMLNPAVDMLYHLGHVQFAKRIERAVYQTICEDKVRTPDLGGTATGSEVMAKILEHV